MAAAQCEVGLWAKEAKYKYTSPARQKGFVQVEGFEKVTQGASGTFGFPNIFGLPNAEVGASGEVTNTWKPARSFNLHPANAEACAKRRPDVGVRDCLRGSQTTFLGGGTVECTKITSAKLNGGVGAKASFWELINVGFSAKGDVTRTFTVKFNAPFEKQPAASGNQAAQR